MRISNSVFAANWLSAQRRAVYRGGAVGVRGGHLQLINCTCVENASDAALHNAGGVLEVMNSILYFNHDRVTQIAGPAAVTYSVVQGGYEGEGNLAFNPILTPQFLLISGSPAIDGGSPEPEHNDSSFPPSQGGDRCDIGITGGPLARLWLPGEITAPQEVFRVELRHVLTWEDHAGCQLEHAVEAAGPWYRYTGPTVELGGAHAVLMDDTEPRKFFRLAKPGP